MLGNPHLTVHMTEVVSGHKFTWTQRIAAAIGVARGIQFLHTGIVPGVFSNDLKITDVLLDHELHVKINNYNLPLLAENRIQVLPEGNYCFAPSRDIIFSVLQGQAPG